MKKKKVVSKTKKTIKKNPKPLKAAVKKQAKKIIKAVLKKVKSAKVPAKRLKIVKKAVKVLKNAKIIINAVKSKVMTKKIQKPVMKKALDLPEQVEWIVKCLNDRKADDIRLFDVSQTAGLWEYYVVCSGASSVHVSALRDNLKKEMGEKGLFKSHEDRALDNKWIVVDFGDILVHVFEKETRSYFALETTLGSTEVSLKGIIKV